MRKAKVPVAVVVLNWNGKALSRDCLKSIARLKPAPERVLLVDNGSKDGSVAMLGKAFPKVELLALKRNLGFAAGNNKGFERLFKKGKKPLAVFVCNNDTELEPAMLGRLWAALRARPRWGIAGPKILYHGSGRVWFNGGFIRPVTGRPGHRDMGALDRAAGPPFELPSSGFVTGCGLLIRSALLLKLKGFDEGFWSYAEDSDLCLRARKLGWASGVVPEARMSHKVSASFKQDSALKQYYATRNSLVLLKRHGLGLGALSRALFALLVVGKRFLGAALTLRWDLARALALALKDYYSGRMGTRSFS